MSNPPDRSGAEQPHRADHFTEAAQLARMGQVFRSRRDDILDYGGDEYDE